MVIKKPIQLAMVRLVPFKCAGAFCAINVENSGESATTTIPQKIKMQTINAVDPIWKRIGERMQQKQERDRNSNANFLILYFLERRPLMIHATLPDAIIRKDTIGI